MPSKNVEALRAAYDGWNRRDFDATVRNVADNYLYTDQARGETLKGKQRFKQYVQAWANSMSDGKITNLRFAEAGDLVIAEFIAEGTNDGPFAGLPPTHQRLKFPFCEIVQFDQSGRMVSGRCYYDLYSILTALGHLEKVPMAA